MDGIANVAKQQQTQVTPQETQTKVAQQSQSVQKSSESQLNQNTQQTDENTKLDSQKKVEDLAKNLNEAIQPLNPDIKFGVDKNDVFYVAAIDAKTHRVIRRFPAEEAQQLLPKMQEVSGILFDSKG